MSKRCSLEVFTIDGVLAGALHGALRLGVARSLLWLVGFWDLIHLSRDLTLLSKVEIDLLLGFL